VQISIQLLPAVDASHGHWELINFCDFIYHHSPELSHYLYLYHQFPPLHILNEDLLTGGRDMGMSGGCLWKPFQITEQEYKSIKEEMLTSPQYDLGYDEEYENLKNFRKWSKAIRYRYHPRRK